ncbi:cellulose biosynthesis cyclic di-GMP-binding regulatory protein BcsB [Marinibacterium sp. SX1]|uniref:cellulose biosynthesis cyclic di-GMP-binding regulatory protein BcsB n=1 Tax=Marinibacterium sp. SX1 TaxID=3388424 RepID=UPI003D169674
MKRILAVAAASLIPLPAMLPAQTAATGGATGTANAPAPAAGIVTRDISLPEIGFADGFEFQQLSGQAVAYVPVGEAEAISAMRLRLDLQFDRTIDVRSHLTVRLADRIAHVEPLEDAGGRATIEIDVPRSAVSSGFVKVGLDYSGANSENICIDERASGDFLRVLPSSALRVDFLSDRLDTLGRVAGAMPRAKRLAYDPALSPAQVLPFVMSSAALFDGEYGLVGLGADGAGDGDGWQALPMQLNQAQGGDGGAVSVIDDAGLPGLGFSGDAPELGVALLGSLWRDLAQGRSTVARVIAPRSRSAEATSFAQLGAPDTTLMVTNSSTYEFTFTADGFPTGQLPAAVELLVGAARSPQNRGVTVSAYLNGSLIGSRPLNEAQPVWMNFAIPRGLVGRENQFAVQVQRQTEAGNCLFAPQGYPAQILPQSRFVLRSAPAPDTDFFLMRQSFASGAEIRLGDGLDLDGALPWVLPIAGAILPDDVALTVQGIEDGGDRPFIHVGPDAPAGSEPPVRFDRGRVEVSDSAGTLLYDGDGLDDVGIVQIVSVDGRNGIWIRPGAGTPPQPGLTTPLLLDRGNVAFVDAQGVALAVSTERTNLLSVTYPDTTTVLQILARYRPWIIGAGWLVLTLLIIRFLLGVYRSRRPSSEG